MLPVICLAWFHRSTFSYIFFSLCKSCPPSHCVRPHTPREGQLPIPHPPWVSVSAAAVASPTFRHGGAEMAAGIDVGACRLQTAGREGVGDRQNRFRWLSHVPFLFDLPCLLAFFSPLRRDLFFPLLRVPLGHALRHNSRHVLGYGRKTKGFGNWKGGFFRRGTVGQTRRRECTKNRTWPHTSLLYNVRLSIDTTSFTR